MDTWVVRWVVGLPAHARSIVNVQELGLFGPMSSERSSVSERRTNAVVGVRGGWFARTKSFGIGC